VKITCDSLRIQCVAKRKEKRRGERRGEKRIEEEGRGEYFIVLPILWWTRTVMLALIHVRLVIHKKYVQGRKERK
jgi:hypothetical protein